MCHFGGHVVEAERPAVVHSRSQLARRRVRRALGAPSQADGLGHDRGVRHAYHEALRQLDEEGHHHPHHKHRLRDGARVLCHDQCGY